MENEATLQVLKHKKIGFLGTGNLAQSLIKGWIESHSVNKDFIFCANRSAGKLQKVVELYGVNPCATNEQLIESSEVIIIAVKPQDFFSVVDPLGSLFQENQIVISLAAGIPLGRISKSLPRCRLARVMPNTPTVVKKGVIGYCPYKSDPGLESTIEDLFSVLGYVVKVEEGEKFDALTVACSAGTGFVFELMLYWQEWIEERGFDPIVARKMTVETFLGASILASQSDNLALTDLLQKVTSKRGVTEAGLQSMQELEIERALRYSFEKASIRNQELARQS